MTLSPLRYHDDNIYDLRSEERLVGSYVYDKDMREMARIRGVLAEPDTHRVRYIVFIEGGFLSTRGKTVLFPIDHLATIDSAKVQAQYTREAIQQAPNPEDIEALTREEEQVILSYFDLEPYWDETAAPEETGLES
ncbi:PRC-barrel domain-containing protein [Nitrospina sp. 32_T5]|uniref:PRC-barrel domain-containing protein n=1 Tax=unclassified Nitrospina TaxID=2638683 RepID=UPI003F9ADE69